MARGRTPLLLSALVAFALLTATSGAQGAAGDTSVGLGLRLTAPPTVMEGVHAPARIMTVAARPGAADGEAWAAGRSDARLPGSDAGLVFDTTDQGGQDVFLRYDHAGGWRVAGLPREPDGSVWTRQGAAYSFRALAIAPDGDGWAGSRTGQLFRRQADGGDWVHVPEYDALLGGAAVISLSLGSDASGTFGFALVDGGNARRLFVLDAGGWRSEPMPDPPAGVSLRRVVAAGRGHAWIVGTALNTSVPAPRPTYVLIVEWSATDGTTEWRRQPTGRPFIDDGRAETRDGVAVALSTPQPVVALTENALWVATSVKRTDFGGPAGSVLPPISGAPNLDQVFLKPDDHAVQPMVVRFALAGGGEPVTTFCPPVARVMPGGGAEEIEVCDDRLPLGIGPIATLDGVAGNAVMGVTPNGLVRFDSSRRTWRHDPTATLGAISGSFASADEGWVVTRRGVDVSPPNSSHLGHWTRRRSGNGMHRWAQPARQPLESIAIAPALAIAVGGRGTALMQLDDGSWDTSTTPTTHDLHGVAFADATTAWAVGNGATVLRFDASARTWTVDASAAASGADLLAVAFDGSGRGWAVGTGGTVIAYDGQTWRREMVTGMPAVTLNAIAVAGEEVVVVGDQATLLVRRAEGSWQRQEDLPALLTYGERSETGAKVPNLLAVAGLADGRAYVGGSTSVLLERGAAGEPFAVSELPPLEGQIHTLAAADRGRDKPPLLVAAVGRAPHRYVPAVAGSGERLANAAGWPFVFDGETRSWRDLQPSRATTGQEVQETPVLRDPVYAVAIGAGDGRGWAVGGLPTRGANDDDENHSGPPAATSSLWRVDTARDPKPEPSPAEVPAAPLTPTGSVGFAFVGDSACVAGLCAPTEGVGTRADAMLRAALADIDRAARAGAVDFVVSGGDQRNIGLADELEPLRELFDELPVPWFGALGDRELVSQVVSVTGVPGAPPVEAAVTADFALGALVQRPRPWGRDDAPVAVRPVPDEAGPTFSDRQDVARTHYAFDYLAQTDADADLEPALRVVVLDTSRLPLALSPQNPNEDQVAWLQRVLLGANGWPSVVVMHRPLVTGLNEDATGSQDAASVTAALVSGGAGALVAGHLPTNRRLDLVGSAGPVPAVVSGALGRVAPEVATQGGFHSWVLVSTDLAAGAGPLGKRPVTVRTIPVLESIALHAPQGRTAAAGHTLSFEGMGRVPDAGTSRHSRKRGNVDEGTSGGPAYLHFPFPGICLPGQSAASGTCRDLLAAVPDHTFRCEDTSICDFVRRDLLDPTRPLVDPTTQRTQPDPTSGLLCARNPGSTFVRLEAGLVAARIPVRITAREAGPCVRVPPAESKPPPPPPIQPEPEPAPQKTIRPAPPVPPAKAPATPVKAPPVKPFVKPIQPMPLPEPLPVLVEAPSIVPRGQPSTQPAPNIVVGAAVPPVANVTPAPPGGSGSPGAAHQKEEEVQAEMASMEMRDARDVLPVLPVLPVHTVSAGLAGALGATLWFARRRRLPRAATPPIPSSHLRQGARIR